jgi:hypothetical protein
VNNAAVIGSAMTDYFLANGTNKAPAVLAPAHIASWLDARGYRIVRLPTTRPVDPGDPDLVARIAALVDWGSPADEDDRHAVVRQVLAAIAASSAAHTDVPRVA